MRCLVTGGSGFIGSALVKELVTGGHSVRVLSRSITPNAIPKEIMRNVELITGDVRDLAIVDKSSRNCDYIYNFSGIVDSDAANSLSVDAIDTEITGLQNVCKSSKKNNIKQIIFGSSCAVYGDNGPTGPLSEQDAVQPKSHYAALKRMGELLIQTYSNEMNLDYLIVRIFNPYGSEQPKNMVIHRFFEAAFKGSPIKIFGRGDQTRDFIYIDDVAKLLSVLIHRKITQEIINICTGQDFAIRSVAEMVINITDSVSDCEFLSTPKGRENAEIERSYGSTLKLEALTGLKPSIGLQEGLKLMYNNIILNQN
jgi:UDP-glucose 4-epimerase